jgi:hypothetical protein
MKTTIHEMLPCLNANGGNSRDHAPRARDSFLVLLLIACFALWQPTPNAFGVVPAPDGCYPNYTTAEGCDALNFLTTGSGNTGLGWRSLFVNTTGNFNTGVGSGALALNNADSNTAVGAAALLLNTAGTKNTAVGTDALVYNGAGQQNTATGFGALFSNTIGELNTATGTQALFNTTTATGNTAVGLNALFNNTEGSNNAAIGRDALYVNETGDFNAAVGYAAGANLTGNGNVCIGASVQGAGGVSDRTWIRNVYSDMATTRVVYIDSDGHLGTLSSSRRYKEKIRPMDKASEALFTLRPVTFRYKKAVDPSQALSFGLIAEEVAKANPALITRDKQGKPQSVRYEQINAMLLNEFLKEHRKVQELEANDAKLQKEIAALTATVKEQTAQIQKVTAQLEMREPVTKVVVNKP